MKIALCDLKVVVACTVSNGIWECQTEPIPVQVPESIARKGARKLFPHLRRLQVLPYSSTIRYFESDDGRHFGFFALKRNRRPILYVEKPNKVIDCNSPFDIPTLTQEYKIDYDTLLPDRHIIDAIKKRREEELREANLEAASLSFGGMLDKVLYQIIDEFSVADLVSMGLSNNRAKSLKYDHSKNATISELKLIFYCLDIDAAMFIELCNRIKNYEYLNLPIVRRFKEVEHRINQFI